MPVLNRFAALALIAGLCAAPAAAQGPPPPVDDDDRTLVQAVPGHVEQNNGAAASAYVEPRAGGKSYGTWLVSVALGARGSRKRFLAESVCRRGSSLPWRSRYGCRASAWPEK